MPLNLNSVKQYVEDHIGEFHARRLEKVLEINLGDVLRSKNPYLFKAKNVVKASEIVDGILSAYLSSSEESVFGNWMERLAIFINDSVYHGRKGLVEGIDLDFDKEGYRYIVSVKSGPSWGNGDQIKKMIDQFNTARKRAVTSGGKKDNLICVNGCCYGRSREVSEYKANGAYYKMCGSRFWDLISGDPNLFVDIIQPLGHEAEAKNNEFKEAYGALVNRFEGDFIREFCKQDGAIDWEKLVRFNSQWPEPVAGKSKKKSE